MHLCIILVGLDLLSWCRVVGTLASRPPGGVHGHVLWKYPDPVYPRLHEISIDETRGLLNDGIFSSVDLIHVGTFCSL